MYIALNVNDIAASQSMPFMGSKAAVVGKQYVALLTFSAEKHPKITVLATFLLHSYLQQTLCSMSLFQTLIFLYP